MRSSLFTLNIVLRHSSSIKSQTSSQSFKFFILCMSNECKKHRRFFLFFGIASKIFSNFELKRGNVSLKSEKIIRK